MGNLIFIASIAVIFASTFYWGFRHLPGEEWQMIAAVPIVKNRFGQWQGLNLTYYGFFNATAMAFACIILLLLMGSIQAPLVAVITVTATGLSVALLSAKIVARIVERKRHTFTVAGAVFVLIISLPWLITIFNLGVGGRSDLYLPPRPMLAAVAIAYTFGEALGRLACISFGCCYGHSLEKLPALIRKRLGRFSFIFTGATKKAIYAGKLHGVPVIPIQAVTSIVFTLAGFTGLMCFLRSRWAAAMIVPLVTTQVWRVLSEFLRADYRGDSLFTAYQVMAIIGLVYSLVTIPFLADAPLNSPSLSQALHLFSNGWLLISVEGVWVAVFLYLGRSSVTGSTVSFHVLQDRI